MYFAATRPGVTVFSQSIMAWESMGVVKRAMNAHSSGYKLELRDMMRDRQVFHLGQERG